MDKSDELMAGSIMEMLDTIQRYTDAEKYRYDFSRVEALLKKAVDIVEETARGVRPKNLPIEIPFSDALDPEEQSDLYCYKGDMEPDDYFRMQEAILKDQQREKDEFKNGTDGVIRIYQTPDEKHCGLFRMNNDGTFNDETEMPGAFYHLPDGFFLEQGQYTHDLRIYDKDRHQVELLNDEDGSPMAVVFSADIGKVIRGIPLYECTRDGVILKDMNPIASRISAAQKNADLQNENRKSIYLTKQKEPAR